MHLRDHRILVFYAMFADLALFIKIFLQVAMLRLLSLNLKQTLLNLQLILHPFKRRSSLALDSAGDSVLDLCLHQFG